MTSRTPRPLKVFTVRAFLDGNAKGQVQAVVAAPTRAAAARAIGISAHQLRTYGGETANPLQIEVAMSDPGAVFFGSPSRYTADASGYTRWEPAVRPDLAAAPTPDPDHQETPMATLATADELAEARREVAEWEATARSTRDQLVRAAMNAGETARIDSLALRLADALHRLRRARSILGDMEAGAGDFHDWDADPDTD